MSKLTPLLEQYHRIKKDYRHTLLLFRMGDFYETFYDDAKIASDVLGIALTSRPHGKKARIPLAGVPYRAIESHMAKLVRAGYKVAICEQTEDPKQAKGIVRREVIEVVTPGTIVRPSLLDEKRNNYLAAFCEVEGKCGVAVCDLTTGEFMVTQTDRTETLDEIRRISPAELLIPESEENSPFIDLCPVTRMDDYLFSFGLARERITTHFGVTGLDGFGLDGMSAGVCAAGANLAYLEETQKRALPHIQSIRTYSVLDYMVLDSATIRNLELVERIHGGGRDGTLLDLLDMTRTPMGGRLLRRYLLTPLLRVKQIEDRQNGIGELLDKPMMRLEVRKVLKGFSDIERLNGRVSCERANPRDLHALAESMKLVPEVKQALSGSTSSALAAASSCLPDVSDIHDMVKEALVDDPPISLKDGGIIREGYDEKLDELRAVSRGGKKWMADLQTKERERTGIASLKVGYNNVFGYYIEVTKPNLRSIPEDYSRRQTLANAERFVTPELKEHESKILGAEERTRSMEYDIFVSLRKRTATHSGRIMAVAKVLAELDVFASLGEVAALRGYTKPTVDDSKEIDVREGRHPVVERQVPGFVPNDTILNDRNSQIAIVTGPNMAGKSTFIRQLAEIVLLAQVGSFVPARSARIGVVDRIFTRVGASDDLARGVSTFLAEMNETALILNSATDRSLVILDEIGRGTSTFDGLSIAWAVVEYLHENPKTKAKTLFATHYHELTELERILPRVRNLNVAVVEKGDDIAFLRKVVPGAADKSYGIHVAKLAGIPVEVVERAKEVLKNLEDDELTSLRQPRIARGARAPGIKGTEQLSIFATRHDSLLRELRELDLNKLSPIEALNLLSELKKKHAE
jgi:DNA mismatch repair protein MutS